MPKFQKKPAGEGRGEWSEMDMTRAVSSVLESRMTERAAASNYNVPRTSLQRRIKSVLGNEQTDMKPQLGYFKPTFEGNYEQILVEHLRDLDSRLMPLAKLEFLKLAYDLAENLEIPHRFNKEKKIAGKDFYISFMKRHPELAYRKPQSTSLMRCVGFNKPQVDRFFNNLKALNNKYNFRPSRIFNGDETGVSCVHENDKVITIKGKRQVGKMTSGERGRNVTLMFSMSATGQFIPPLFIFPRKRMNERLMIGAPTESCAFPTTSGWMTTEAFLKWMQHFVSFAKPTENDPVLLLIDGHGTHKELEIILFARAHHVYMLSFPPHTTHKLQPLDRAFMKPFKDQYNHACSLWMRANPGARINDYDIAKLVNDAYRKVCRLEIAANGFSCTGIHPFNPEIFTDLDFMGSALTNVEQRPSTSTAGASAPTTSSVDLATPAQPSNESTGEHEPTLTEPTAANEEPASNEPTASNVEPTSTEPLAANEPFTTEHTSANKSTEKPTFTSVLKTISPLPSCSENRVTSRKRKAEKSEILTSTPNKEFLIEKKRTVAEKEAAKEARRNLKFEKQQQKPEKGQANVKRGKIKKKEKVKSVGPLNVSKPATAGTSKQDYVESTTDEKVDCLVCGENYEESWIQCKTCEGWTHELCANIDDTLYYYCDVCKFKK